MLVLDACQVSCAVKERFLMLDEWARGWCASQSSLSHSHPSYARRYDGMQNPTSKFNIFYYQIIRQNPASSIQNLPFEPSLKLITIANPSKNP